MMFGRYAVDEPCTACGRHACEGCVTGLMLNSEGDGLVLADEPDWLDQMIAANKRTSYTLAIIARAQRELGYGR